jgi:hypothetical protein
MSRISGRTSGSEMTRSDRSDSPALRGKLLNLNVSFINVEKLINLQVCFNLDGKMTAVLKINKGR